MKNVFLHKHLAEIVYYQQPPGFINPATPDHLGFIASTSDTFLFVYKEGSSIIYLLLYVDDIILTALTLTLLRHIMGHLDSEFAMTDLGNLHHFLGISVMRSSQGMFVSQRHYALDLLQRAGMPKCHAIVTLVDTHAKLLAQGSAKLQDGSKYRSLSRALQYLTMTQPDLAYAVQQVCLFMHDSCKPHMALIKRILRYVKGTLSSELHIGIGHVQSLTAYSDADWASCPDSRCSTSSFCIYLGDNLELYVPLASAIVVYSDNMSAVYMTANPMHHWHTKHIEIDIHFVHEKVALGEV
ncbi:uncharacterized mitochondrial protein AtMg00810-like [Setaria viridis]|uniref:uncharacterized mitochondrial protein AtMg00810-like n=1 Tax=Setaria viridis TaxID=4556 RepID=UPI001493D3F1|nr:uncharacterized mitochondrial protein AtMg00810-like [Setaria viridis]